MKNNKIIVTLFSIATLIVIFTFFSLQNIFMTSINKLMGDVSYPTSNGVKISCDKSSIAVDETATCTLTGHLDGGASGISGHFETKNGIQIQNISLDSNWQNYATNSDFQNEHMIFAVADPPINQFIVATVTIKGLYESSGTLSFVGNERDNYKVKISNSNSESIEVADATYNITVSNNSGGGEVIPTPSSDNTLKNLKVGTENVSLTDLTCTVANNVSQVSITAVTNDTNASYVVSNSQNNSVVNLTEGENNFTITVTAESGATRTYNIKIIRQAAQAKSSINTLKTLTVSNTTLVPVFNSSITGYTATVDNSINSVTVNATRTDDKSSIISGLGEHDLNVGINTIDVNVKAENGSVKTYSVVLTRKEYETITDDTTKSKDNTLKSLSVKDGALLPEFDSSKIQNYIAIVADDVTNVIVNAKANDSKATVSFSENMPDNTVTFNANDNTKEINIIVTAENGSKKYTPLTIMRRSYYNQNKNEIDNNISNITDKCELILRSSIYTIDNDKLEINNVNKNHTIDTIKSNLSSDCGTISVGENKVILASDTQVKEYKINRVWIPQTGQKVIKYSIVILVLLLGIVGLIYYKKKMDK